MLHVHLLTCRCGQCRWVTVIQGRRKLVVRGHRDGDAAESEYISGKKFGSVAIVEDISAIREKSHNSAQPSSNNHRTGLSLAPVKG